jgi:hypothetical protein
MPPPARLAHIRRAGAPLPAACLVVLLLLLLLLLVLVVLVVLRVV